MTPFLVVASAGTTNTGAVDPIADIGEVARSEGAWFHVDAAYGGFFQLTDRGRARFAGIEEADSITLDPHKGMFLPYGTGSLLVRDGALLKAAHQAEAQYLPHATTDAAIPDFADFSPELSRDYRGLRVWLPLSLHGIDTFRRALDEKLDLTDHVYDALSSAPNLEVPWKPDLSIVAFRPRAGGNDAAKLLLDRINDSKRIFLSDTVVDGRSTLRVLLLGVVVLKERLSRPRQIAVGLACAGVAVLAWGAGSGLWISLTLAVSFALYGFLRKVTPVESLEGLTIETAILAPIALGWILWLEQAGTGGLGIDRFTTILLVLAGAVTAVPLLLFNAAAKRLPYSTLGFLQYIAPSLQFLLAVLLFGERLTTAHLICFGAIWTALVIFAAEGWRIGRANARERAAAP